MTNKVTEVLKEPHRYWLEWVLTYFKGETEFKITHYNLVHERDKIHQDMVCAMPLIWLKDLVDFLDIDPKHILRTPRHRPEGRTKEDAESFIKFISILRKLVTKNF